MGWTAISLLWNAADLLGKGSSAGIEHEAGAGQPSQSPSVADRSSGLHMTHGVE